MTDETTTHILDLNEYCLLEIFAQDSFTPMDLLLLAETCTRFKGITQRLFPKEFVISIHLAEPNYLFYGNDKFIDLPSTEYVRRILTHFGSYLNEISIFDNIPDIFDSIAKYCNDGGLKRINFCEDGIIENLLIKFKNIFPRLVALSFHRTFSVHPLDGRIIKLNCSSLIELEIYDNNCWHPILKNTFPKLERFACNEQCYYESELNVADILLNFITRHSRLKHLSLSGYKCFRHDITHTIGNNLNKLEELNLCIPFKSHFTFSDISLKKVRN